MSEAVMCVDHLTPGHDKTEHQHRHDICMVGRWLYEQGFVPATDGNLSVRLSENRILTTPAGTCKGRLDPREAVITDMEGRRLEGRCEPSTELGMHLLIYRLRRDVNAVCHAHPPIATGFAAAGSSLEKPLIAEMVVNLGPVPLAPYAEPGSHALRDSLEPFVRQHDAILMANHGVVTYGTDLLTAFRRMECVEHCARITLVTELLGKQSLLSGRDVEKLLAAHPRHKI
ncbi:MAG: class II aldolase/adducin family protein [Candidatus Acidiferrales bacterium]